MRLAYLSLPGRGATDRFIETVADDAAQRGLRLAGICRCGAAEPGGHPCDMDLRVLPDGPLFRISQPLGRGARGCRLDAGVIETIAAEVSARLAGADLLLINKFGKLEAQGRGLCPVICDALEAGIPTLIGVNRMNIPEFRAFAGEAAEPLSPDLPAIRRWYRGRHRASHAGTHATPLPASG